MEQQTINFKSFLQNEFIARCRKNGSYSLRAFAKSLKLSPSALSEMINGKRPITAKTKSKIALLLRLSPEQISKLGVLSNSTDQGKFTYDQITIDSFAIIADWYHFAILELLSIKGFKEDAQWIAHTLSISPTEVTIAIERLLRLGLLKRDDKGRLKDGTSGHSTSLNKGVTGEAVQRFLKQVLKKAIESISTVPLDLRDHTGMTFAINTKDIEKAKKKIEAFRRDMNEFFSASKDYDEVYQLSIALFPLTRINEIKKIKNSKGDLK